MSSGLLRFQERLLLSTEERTILSRLYLGRTRLLKVRFTMHQAVAYDAAKPSIEAYHQRSFEAQPRPLLVSSSLVSKATSQLSGGGVGLNPNVLGVHHAPGEQKIARHFSQT